MELLNTQVKNEGDLQKSKLKWMFYHICAEIGEPLVLNDMGRVCLNKIGNYERTSVSTWQSHDALVQHDCKRRTFPVLNLFDIGTMQN